MEEELKSEGKYELFTTPEGNEVVNFDKEEFYLFTKKTDAEYILSIDPDPNDLNPRATGKYFFVGAKSEDDPGGSLYLEDGSDFRKFDFPEGFPTKKDDPGKKIRRTNDRLKKEDILKKMGS